MPVKRDLEREQRMVEAYDKGFTGEMLTARFGGSRNAIYNILRRYGREPARNYQRTTTKAPGERAKDLPPERYLNRDPCTYCGVRGDIGCKHRRDG